MIGEVGGRHAALVFSEGLHQRAMSSVSVPLCFSEALAVWRVCGLAWRGVDGVCCITQRPGQRKAARHTLSRRVCLFVYIHQADYRAEGEAGRGGAGSGRRLVAQHVYSMCVVVVAKCMQCVSTTAARHSYAAHVNNVYTATSQDRHVVIIICSSLFSRITEGS